MMNHVSLMGRLTVTPEIRMTSNDTHVTAFSVAVDRNYKIDSEQVTDFINVVAWRQMADFICDYFEKGQMIAIEGEIQTRKYEDKNGDLRTVVEVNVVRAHFAGSKPESKQDSRSRKRNYR